MVLSKQIGVFLNFVHNRCKQNINEAFEKGGYKITAEQFLLLDTLWTEGPISQQRIADVMLKDKNSVVKLVDSLESRGLVRRATNPKDRRQNIIRTTPKADRMQEAITGIAIETIAAITAGISDDDLVTVINVLDAMAANMDQDVKLKEHALTFPTKK
ncbi:MAG: MarR family transcriptional regulator [Bacteroidales bacterium]|nr:MarR family transcriptional regulator [Bacteroidales bacterium]